MTYQESCDKIEAGWVLNMTEITEFLCYVKNESRCVYRMSTPESWVRNRERQDTKPAGTVANSTTAIGRAFRLWHDFTLPTILDNVINNLNLNDFDNTASELSIQVLDTYITVPDWWVWIQYQWGSEWYRAIEVGECCWPLVLKDELWYTDREDNNAIVWPVFLPEWQHAYRAWNIDTWGTNSSHAVRYSNDWTTFSAVLPTWVELFVKKREVEMMEIWILDEIPEWWTVCYPKQCSPVIIDPEPVEEVEEIDLSNYLECPWDLPAFTTPTFTATQWEITQQIDMTQESADYYVLNDDCEFKAVHERYVRVRFQTSNLNTWNFITIPSVAWYKTPKIIVAWTYRQSGNPNDDDLVTANEPWAMPDAPYMWQEATEWSSTQRVYFGQFNNKDAESVYRAMICVKYQEL